MDCCCHKTKAPLSEEQKNPHPSPQPHRGAGPWPAGDAAKGRLLPGYPDPGLRRQRRPQQLQQELLATHIRTCVADGIRQGDDAVIDELVTTLQKLMK